MCVCVCVCVCVAVQGDAAFWWNLKKSGEGDLLTRHAGCPVLVGSKWGKSLCIAVHVLVCVYTFVCFKGDSLYTLPSYIYALHHPPSLPPSLQCAINGYMREVKSSGGHVAYHLMSNLSCLWEHSITVCLSVGSIITIGICIFSPLYKSQVLLYSRMHAIYFVCVSFLLKKVCSM